MSVAIQRMTFNKGAFTSANHLGIVASKRPEFYDQTVGRIFSAEVVNSGNILTSGVKTPDGRVRIGRKQVAGLDWSWRLYGRPSLQFTVKGDVMTGNPQRGRMGTPMRVWLNTTALKHGDVIKPTNQDTKLVSMVMGPGTPKAGGAVYTIQLLKTDPNLFIPEKYFKLNATWGLVGHLTGEASEHGGSAFQGSILSFKNKLINHRMQRKVTDYAIMKDKANGPADIVAFTISNGNGQYGVSWLDFEEMEFNQQFEFNKEKLAWSSRDNGEAPHLSEEGYPVTAGAGVEEQLEDMTIPYTHFSWQLLEDTLMSIFYNRVSNYTKKDLVTFTGTYGLLQANNAGKEWMRNNNVVINMQDIAVKDASRLHGVSYQIGYQITRFNLTNNISVDFVEHPYLDNRDLFAELDEFTGYPKRSRWYFFLDFANDGKPNVHYVENTTIVDTLSYTFGRIGPGGMRTEGSHTGNYYEVVRQAVFGVEITDTTRGGVLRPL